MTPSTITFDSLLALDIGETTTRALLFDIVDGGYRFIAAGSAPSTMGLPFRNVMEGARMAIDELQELTGRTLIGRDERLVVPSTAEGYGVDAFALVMSGGPPLRAIVAGLLEDVSVESARRLAASTYTTVVDVFSLNDRRKSEMRLDAILHLRPNMILVAGGTEAGAEQSIGRLLEPVRLACNLLPEESRPQILYAGNPNLGEKIKAAFSPLTHVELAPNVRPTLDTEQLEPAHVFLARLYRSIRLNQINGLDELDSWSGGSLLPRATAFGRVIRFLSLDDPSKGVLGVDLGASSTTLAASIAGNLNLGVYTDCGLVSSAIDIVKSGSVARVMSWLPIEIPEEYVRDYLYNKHINASALPVTQEDLAIEQALARYIIRQSVLRLSPSVRSNGPAWGSGLLPPMEPIIASGSVITHAPSQGQSMLMLLDALQPTGITTVILDRNNLAASLGAAASVNPTLVVQVLDSGTFANLGTVISPVSTARLGAPVLRVQLSYKESGDEIKLDVKQGSLEVLQLAQGQVASLYLKPFHRADIGMGPGRGGRLNRIVGGALGVIIDARGRPLRLSDTPDRRRELHKKWLWTLGS